MSESNPQGTAPARRSAKGAAKAGTPEVDIVPVDYESALAELETLVAKMESGALTLEDSMSAYGRGAVLVAYCEKQLAQVEQQVKVLDAQTLRAFEPNVDGDAE